MKDFDAVEVKPYKSLCKSEKFRRSQKIGKQLQESTKKIPHLKRARVQLDFSCGSELEFTHDIDHLDAPSVKKRKTDDAKVLTQLLFIKDKYGISDAAIHELHMLFPSIPPLNVIKEKRKEMSQKVPVKDVDDVSVNLYIKLFHVIIFQQKV